MKEKKARRKKRDAMDKAVDKYGRSKLNGRGPKNVKEAKDVALKGLVKSGKGVTVVGKESGKGKGKVGGRKGERPAHVAGEGRKLKL